MSVTNVVQRHRTIPMTKRDSLSTNGSRLSLISNTSITSNNKHLNEKETTGTKRTRKVKRTESYKKATERQSVYEELCASKGRRVILSTAKDDDRRKYNTLPIRRESNNNEIDINSCNSKSKKDKHSPFVVRNSSVKSGTYPSPDTDDDEWSVGPEKKKKSGFKRFKERLLFMFQKDDRERNRRREKEKYSHSVRGNWNNKSGGKDKHTDNKRDNEYAKYVKNETNFHQNVSKEHKSTRQNGSESNEHKRTNDLTQDSSGKIRKELNIFKSFRDSLRRKSPPEYRRQGSKDTQKRNSGEARYPEHVSTNFSNVIDQNSSRGHLRTERQNNERQSDRNSHNGRYIKHGPDTKPSTATMDSKTIRGVDDELEDNLDECLDITTDIFGAIIDPTGRPVCANHQSFGRQRSLREDSVQSRRPDRTKLTLEGLRKYRPKSAENSPLEVSRAIYQRQSSGARCQKTTTVVDVYPATYSTRYPYLPSEVEIDGPDYADGVIASEEEEISGLSDAYIDEQDHKRAVNNVAQCLKIIADKIVAEKQRSVTEDEIVRALREIADDVDKQYFQGKDMPVGVPRELLPVIKNIIKAKSYNSFVDVIKQETAQTIGWDQVAWYTFLTKSALQITGLGKKVGQIVKSRAMKYFSSSIRPWVESRPYGWESIHEETDIESELD